jgi:hypothetical protein
MTTFNAWKLLMDSRVDINDAMYGNYHMVTERICRNVEMPKVVLENRRLNINDLLNTKGVPIIWSKIGGAHTSFIWLDGSRNKYRVVKLLIADERVNLN